MIYRRLMCLAVGLVLLSASTAKADVIYDAITGQAFSFTGSLNRSRVADAQNNIAATPNFDWLVDQIDMNFVVAAAGTYADVTARIRIWDTWTPTAPVGTSVFSGLLSDVTWGFGTLTVGGATGFGAILDYSAFGFLLDDTQFGFDVEFRVAGVLNNAITMGISNTATPTPPVVGSTAFEGFYRDVTSNGLIDSTDARDFTNLHTNVMIRVHANQIPEPSTMMLLGVVGVVACGLRRRRAV
jgi:PEP-CTERM motif